MWSWLWGSFRNRTLRPARCDRLSSVRVCSSHPAAPYVLSQPATCGFFGHLTSTFSIESSLRATIPSEGST
ncbi:hypothetical protein IE53DRAFT_386490 [Violaceomyces palustris]|uniref:Uncharacterized protein n=1 Tax=Violaceomyces palustris TaxID=1673888 RepID=A0ACD0NZ86_9BASI|nr:hypothetical protein IE53DRAFT_386490 [Violaceomyces palustris]